MRARKRDIEYPFKKLYSANKAPVAIPSRIPINIRPLRIRESLSWFSEKMEKDLQGFDRSMSAWETESAVAILDDLNEKVIELRSKFVLAMRCTHPNLPEAVINQCVEVANLAHMIASCQHPTLCHYRKGNSVQG